MQILCGTRAASFDELLDRSARTASWLHEQVGARPGGTVILGLENGIEHIELVLATWRLRSEVVVVPPTISTQTLQSILASRPGAVLAIDARNERLLRAIDDQFRRWSFGEGSDALVLLSETSPGTTPLAHRTGAWTEWLTDLPPATFFTSGSTAEAKGVLLAWPGILDKGRRVLGHYGATPADRVMPILPLSHVYGLYLLLGAVDAGADVIILPESASPARIAESLVRQAASIVICPPIIGGFLYGRREVEEELRRSLRVVSMGGAATRPDVAAAMVRHLPGVRVFLSYGLAETYSTICCNEISIPGADPLTVGPVMFGSFGEVRDPETRALVAPGGIGELQVGGTITAGYVSANGDPQPCLTPAGLFRTGDLVHVDERGHVFIRGRLKEMINAGGLSIVPSEVEEVIKAHPSVHDCGVFGQTMGELEVLCAAVVFADGTTSSEIQVEALYAHCEAHLSRKMVPKRVIAVSTIPRGGLGKVKRAELKAMCEGIAP